MSQEMVDLASRGYEALAAGDLERVLELIDPNVELEVLTGRPDLPQRLHGHEGFVENIKGLTDVFEDIEIVPEDFVAVGDELVVSIFASGHGRSSGIRVENRVAHIWTIRDGKAIRFRIYPTTEQALAAVGLTGPGETPGA